MTILPAFSLITTDIAGDQAEVETLFPAPFDVHYVSLKPSQKMKLEEADFIVATHEFNNLLNEYHDKVIITPEIGCHDNHCSHCQAEHNHNHDNNDHSSILVHEWLSFDHASALGFEISRVLSKHNPEHREYYHKNAHSLSDNLKSLKESYQNITVSDQKVFICNGFFHLERELDVTFGVALKKCHDTNITPSILNDIVSNQEKYKYLVVEPPFNRDSIQKILDKTGLKLRQVDTFGSEIDGGYVDYLDSVLKEMLY